MSTEPTGGGDRFAPLLVTRHTIEVSVPAWTIDATSYVDGNQDDLDEKVDRFGRELEDAVAAVLRGLRGRLRDATFTLNGEEVR